MQVLGVPQVVGRMISEIMWRQGEGERFVSSLSGCVLSVGVVSGWSGG